MSSALPQIAVVGGGPTAIYTLQALIEFLDTPAKICVFEEQGSLGRGTPYRPGWNDPAMLSNIASIELPPLGITLVDWLQAQPDEMLKEIGVDRTKISDRTFYPRLVLGEYFRSQSAELLAKPSQDRLQIDLRTFSRVTDVSTDGHSVTLCVRPIIGSPYRENFDYVILATGHQWPAEPEIKKGYFLSPWPASALSKIPPCEIGIRGTSLTAVDAMVALAALHGEFVEGQNGALAYVAKPNAGNFHVTMLSRKGILAEADFYAPIPYEPLSFCTEETVAELIARNPRDLLDRVFDLFKLELVFADPDYGLRLKLLDLTLEEFHDRYFADRMDNDPFVWAQQNLKEARRNYDYGFVVRWRYAILRMHEVVERLVPHLEAHDYRRFGRYFKPVFVDDYATVPHKSIKRMIALHEAGKLDIIAVGENYSLNTECADGGAELTLPSGTKRFPVFIEAMGQQALQARDFPFQSLVRDGVVRDVQSKGQARGIAIDDAFHPISDDTPTDRIFCLSLPFILGRHPFHQGITSSFTAGRTVAADLAATLARSVEREATADVSA